MSHSENDEYIILFNNIYNSYIKVYYITIY